MSEEYVPADEDIIAVRSQAIRNLLADMKGTRDPRVRALIEETIEVVLSTMRREVKGSAVLAFERAEPGKPL
ncbi:hypothetical protein [Roseixanthobacter pseudopolyaromaticivorans]|uniref:hypothetical protein n=1 Tax=Xanthobacteraceae TaxID=335928 RepID=UPI0037267C5D